MRYTSPLAFALLCAALYAQTPSPAFEVASIRPTSGPLGPTGFRSEIRGGPGTHDPTTFTCRNCSIPNLINEAYGPLYAYNFVAPDNIAANRFDVTARVPAGATKEQFRAMIGALLAERFKLAIHHEKRPMQVYELTPAKMGTKVKESKPKDRPEEPAASGPIQHDSAGYPILPPGITFASYNGVPRGYGRIRLEGSPVSGLTVLLSTQFQAPVIDATGLTGRYDFLISWTWEHEDDDTREYRNASLLDAVQTQLGLKLQRKKGEAEVLVVDHVEKTPIDN